MILCRQKNLRILAAAARPLRHDRRLTRRRTLSSIRRRFAGVASGQTQRDKLTARHRHENKDPDQALNEFGAKERHSAHDRERYDGQEGGVLRESKAEERERTAASNRA